ncbi:Gfo/Idh/MocA family oxidoreductase [Egibacter rhizosphaerae]|uniref:Gfo/Idh/MocA family oxidoreductase n=2 Tax=Egibacter rhizosphaerae TaxID=1670831 RepID=A0A411YL84_9ACTN|nr:Gfo/Idh/MocA family oxidoreductase [Egibacter rhizosphaerae]
MGRVHSRAYRRLRDHFPETVARPELVIVADASPDRRAEAADVHGYRETTDQWQRVAEHPDVDVVSIAVPNFLHREIAIAAARAGKHLWLEKPCGRVPAETAEIAEEVERAGIHTAVGFNYRYTPAVERARELLAAGAVGTPTHYRGHFLADYASDPRGGRSWRFQEAYGGLGVLGDVMSHAADMACHLLGPIDELSAERAVFVPERPRVSLEASHFDVSEDAALAPVENEDYAASLVRFAGGARGTLEASRVTVGPHVRMAFELHGTEGALAWDFERMNELWRYDRRDPDPGYRRVLSGPGTAEHGRFQPSAGIGLGFDDLKVIEVHRFLEGIVDDEPRAAGLPEAAAVMAVIGAMQRAARTGSRVTVEPLTTAPSGGATP